MLAERQGYAALVPQSPPAVAAQTAMKPTTILTGPEMGEHIRQLCRSVSRRCLITTWSLGAKVTAGPIQDLWMDERQFTGEIKIILDFDFRFGVHVDPASLGELLLRLGPGKVLRHRACHAKIFVVDDVALVGSANLSASAFSGDVWEAGVRTEDPDLVKAAVRQFRRIERESLEVTMPDVQRLIQASAVREKFEMPRFEWPTHSLGENNNIQSSTARRLGEEFAQLLDTEVDPGDLDDWNQWIAAHPEGFFLNHNAGGRKHFKLHRVTCGIWRSKERDSLVSVPRPRHCDRRILESAALRAGLTPSLCQSCLRGWV